jgi:hypothetical protein
VNALRLWWWRFQHGQLMDRSAMLDQLARESLAESDRCMQEAAELRRRININMKRAACGLRVLS